MKLLSALVLVLTIAGALSVKCSLKQCKLPRCRYDYVDCTTCKCLPAPTSTPTVVASVTCSPILCLLHCQYGFVKDKNGCNVCKCAPPPPSSPSPVTCSPVKCKLLCHFGYQKDANGCDICKCARPPTSSPTSVVCSPVKCRLICHFGYQKDANGCDICKCARPPTPLPSAAPSPSTKPAHPCKNVTCKAGYTCKHQTVQCVKSPCPRQPVCVNPCDGIVCANKGGVCSAKAPVYRPLCSCSYNNKQQMSGSTFNATDGCNTCTCRNGTLACTKKLCHCTLPCPLGTKCEIVKGKQACVKIDPCSTVRCSGGCSVVKGKAYCGCAFSNTPLKYGQVFRANNTCMSCNCTRAGSVRCVFLSRTPQGRCRPTPFCQPAVPCQLRCKSGYTMNGSCATCQCASGVNPTMLPTTASPAGGCSLPNGQSKAVGSVWKTNSCTSCRCLPSSGSNGPQRVCVTHACPAVTCKNAKIPSGKCCSVCPMSATQPPKSGGVTLCRIYYSFLHSVVANSQSKSTAEPPMSGQVLSYVAPYLSNFVELANAWPSLPFTDRNISLANVETPGRSMNFFAPACQSDGTFSTTQCSNVTVQRNGKHSSIARCLCVNPTTGDPSSSHPASSRVSCPPVKTSKCQKQRAASLTKLFSVIFKGENALQGSQPSGRPSFFPQPSGRPLSGRPRSQPPRPSASTPTNRPGNAVLTALQQILGQSNVSVPNCRTDNNFASRQCAARQCWCVNPLTGVEVPNTRRPSSSPLTRCPVVRPTGMPSGKPSKRPQPSTAFVCPSVQCGKPCSGGRAVDNHGCQTCRCLPGKCDSSSVMSCFAQLDKSSVGVCSALQQVSACFKRSNVNGAIAGCSVATNATISKNYGQLRMNITKVCRSKKQCIYGGRTRMNGTKFPSQDGCNTCFCTNGQISCTEKACVKPAYCIYDGNQYSIGDSFDALDGCNECSCSETGESSCGSDPCKSTKYVKSTITFEANYNQIITDDVAKSQFKLNFASSLAKALGISASQIYVISISSGSIVVESAIQGSNLTAIENELDSVISSNQFTLMIDDERLTASNLHYSYAQQVGALPTDGDDSSDSGSVSTALIIGVSVAGAVAVILVIVVVVLVVNGKKSKENRGVSFVNGIYSGKDNEGEVKLSDPLYDNPPE